MAPITLTKKQFLATAAAKKPGATYDGYLHYVANARAKKLAAPPADPYTSIIAQAPKPYSPGQIQGLVGQETTGYAPSLTPAQIQSQATAEISPLVQAASKSISDQAARNAEAITGVSKSLASELAGMNYAAPYQPAEQGQAAVDAALQSSLNNVGSNDAADLGKRLAAINDPAVSLAAAAVKQNAGLNAGTQVAQGSNALADLIANQAANVAYGQKQPGIAQLAGLQTLGTNAQQANQQIGDTTRSLEAQLPSIISDLQSRSDSNQNTRASAAASALANLLGVNEDRAKNLLSLAANQLQRNDDINAAAGKNLATVQTAEIKAAQADSTARTKAKQPSASLTKANGYLTANDGTPIRDAKGNYRPIAGYKLTNNGQGVVSTKQTGGGKTPTPDQLNTLVDQWKNGKTVTQSVKAPNPDSNGNPVYRKKTVKTGQLSYQQAYKRLRALNVADAQARQVLDSAYKRGEQGRAWLSNDEQAVLRKTQGVAKTVHMNTGVAYIDRDQAAALKAAGVMPPGHWIQGRTNTQDLGPVYVIAETY